MASSKGSKVLGNAKKAATKEYEGRINNKGSGSYGPKTTNSRQVGKVAQAGEKMMPGIAGIPINVNRYTAAKGSSFDTATRLTGRTKHGSQFRLGGAANARDIVKSEKGGGFSRKAKVVKKKK